MRLKVVCLSLLLPVLIVSFFYAACKEPESAASQYQIEADIPITPADLNGQVGKEYIFTAHLDRELGSTEKCYWIIRNVEEGLSEDNYISDNNKLLWTFKKAGEYKIILDVWDPESGNSNITRSTSTPLAHIRKVNITPSELIGEPGKSYSFSVDVENRPREPEYLWNFGDGTQTERTQSNTLSHTYSNQGDYVITVSLYSGAASTDILATATTNAQIRTNLGLLIVPPESPIYTAVDSVFRVQCESGLLPENPFCWWNFGDGTDLLGIPGSNEAIHLFSTEGTYDVTVRLINEDTGEELASATTQVVVIEGTIDYWQLLRQTNYIEIELCTPRTNSAGSGIGCWDFGGDETVGRVVWRDDGFTSSWAKTLGDGTRITETINCSVSPDGSTITSLTAYLEYDYTDRPTEFYELELINVPIISQCDIEGYPYFDSHIRNETVEDYVNIIDSNDLISVEWSSDSQLFILIKQVTPQ